MLPGTRVTHPFDLLHPASTSRQAQLQPIQPARGGPPFGFHPACAPLKSLFDQKRLAVVANMGMLALPSTRTGLETGGAPRPANLFSHAEQELALHSADYAGFTRTGWGGRIADRLDAANPGTLFPGVDLDRRPANVCLGSYFGTADRGRESVFHAIQQRRRSIPVRRRCATPRCARCCRKAAGTPTTSSRSCMRRKALPRRPWCFRSCRIRRRWSRRSSRASTLASRDSSRPSRR